uniref:Uncharacterized protein n=1 Tax=Leptocylindrus danicus TaxID=163516 RepID=A0A7S2KK35_9STRA|mmetsp:Transcript_23303/g.34990  ORF Transcript_23303/g.34990 Transcript_23303/m.34990 type:complete len:359 (+) Transcript_23303:115-1191(+)
MGKQTMPRSYSICSSDDEPCSGIENLETPAVVLRGTERGNDAPLHRRVFLEVADELHRYGKHLRIYYDYWESLGKPYGEFFTWLDSKGEASGEPLPDLKSCPREVLDHDTVLYIDSFDATSKYALTISKDSRCCDDIQNIPRFLNAKGEPLRTGRDKGWIFVLRDDVLYAAPKITTVNGRTKQRFHHSSFFGGKAVASAGIFITDDGGHLLKLYPHSGHYRPGERHLHRILLYLKKHGVILENIEVDLQQIYHMSRELTGTVGSDMTKTSKLKKVQNLYLLSGDTVESFLSHKRRMINSGVFRQVHDILSVKKLPEDEKQCDSFPSSSSPPLRPARSRVKSLLLQVNSRHRSRMVTQD